jgi:integrase
MLAVLHLLQRVGIEGCRERLPAPVKPRRPGQRGANHMTISELVRRYEADHPNLAESTVEGLRYAGRLFSSWKKIAVEDVRRADATAFCAWLVKNGASDGTNHKNVQWLKVLWRHAVAMELVDRDPWLHVKGGKRPKPKGWRQLTDEEFNRILEACPSPEWKRLFALCRWAGLRRGEALSLRWVDVDVVGRWMTVRGKTGEREVPMSPRLVPLLDGVGAVCPSDNGSLNRIAAGIFSAAGVGGFGTAFHSFRKMCASEWLAAGIPLADCSKYLGHSEAILFTHYHKPLSAAMITEAA